MSFNWQDEWERHAKKESEAQRKESLSDLLADVEAGWFGNYYKIWYEIVKKAKSKAKARQAIPILINAAQKMLAQKEYEEDLHIIHCLTAICKLLRIPEKEAEKYIYAQDKLQSLQVLKQVFENSFENQ
ncbi:MAG: hypothetical protein RML38_10380 [Bacteroidia bacterium]|nr:hypothetical protein [Bacteroidia bacterium]